MQAFSEVGRRARQNEGLWGFVCRLPSGAKDRWRILEKWLRRSTTSAWSSEPWATWEGARASHAEGLTFFRALANKDPDLFRKDVAAALTNLSMLQLRMLDLDGAQSSCEEALAIVRKLPANDPYAARSGLAKTLDNLASILSARGDNEGAFANQREALDHFRKMSEKVPGAYRADIARSLTNLGFRLTQG